MRIRDIPGWAPWVVLASVLVAGCNGGLVALGLGSSSSSSSNTGPVVSDLEVLRSPTSPASISFVVFDAEGDASDVAIRYRPDGSADFQDITVPAGGPPLKGIPSDAGTPYVVEWDFAADFGGDGYRGGLELELVVSGGVSPPILTGVEVGNDAPELVAAGSLPEGEEEYAGNVDVGFEVRDSAGDVLRIRVEYNDDSAGGYPEGSWKLARPAATPASLPTPEYAITGFPTLRAGTTGTFRWDTAFDLAGFDGEVRVRFTPEDAFAAGTSMETVPFRVDNNGEPIAIVEGELFRVNRDASRGIPIPYRVIDEESDPVRVVLQWRREDDDFPTAQIEGVGEVDLESVSASELLALLDDPDRASEREALQICTELPSVFQGVTAPLPDGLDPLMHVRLPELAGSASGLLAWGVAGRTLELLRPNGRLDWLVWETAPLERPVAALPVGDGETALVLDAAGAGWRVVEVELSTGEVSSDMAAAPSNPAYGGEPAAMAYEHGARAVLVVSNLGGFWQLHRVELETGVAVRLASAFELGLDPALARGVASLGTDAALITAGDALLEVRYRPGEPPEVTVALDGLDTPWGVAVDPLERERVYVSETGKDRVLVVGRNDRRVDAVPALVAPQDEPELGPLAFPSPRGLALARSGSRLLVLCSQPGGTPSLRGVDRRSPVDFDLSAGGRADSFVFEIPAELAQGGGGVATGPDSMRLVAQPGAGTLAVGGGVEASRTLAADSFAYDPSLQTVTLSAPLKRPPRSGSRWRVRCLTEARGRSSPVGAENVYLWDSRDAWEGNVLVRALPIDAEVGTSGTSATARPVHNAPPFVQLGGVGVTSTPWALAAGDLDGDGDTDLVSGNLGRGTLTVFYQSSSGSFDPDPRVVGGPAVTRKPISVAVADVDGDGRNDLVSADGGSCSASKGFVTVLRQDVSGGFVDPVFVGGSSVSDCPRTVVVADMDRDGDVDIVTANIGGSPTGGNRLTVFLQTPEPFVFDPEPIFVGGPGITDGAACVVSADVDRDGDLDLVSSNIRANAQNLTVFRQTSPLEFAPSPEVLGGPGLTDLSWSLEVADVDADGAPDLVSANVVNRSLIVFHGKAGRFETVPLVLEAPGRVQEPYAVHVADLDGDGEVSLISANAVSNNLTVFRRSGDTFLPSPIVLGGPGITSAPRSVVTLDVSGDGTLDVACGNTVGSHTLTVFRTASGNMFDPVPLVLGGPGITGDTQAVATADVDGDGDVDLVAASGAYGNPSNVLTVFFQIAAGEFDPKPLVLGGEGVTDDPGWVVPADMDGDGDVDLVSANIQGDDLTVFLQVYPGTFDPEPVVVQTRQSGELEAPWCVDAADLDGDGDLDLVAANSYRDDLVIFRQTSSDPLRFRYQRTLKLDSPFTVRAVDVDGDGDMDLVSSSFAQGLPSHPGPITVFLHEPPFAYTRLLVGEGYVSDPHSVIAADVDGDGDVDLVSANEGSDDLTVFWQTSPGVFAEVPTVLGRTPPTLDPNSVAAADVDGDGDLDLVAAHFGTAVSNGPSTLSVFRQTFPGVFDPTPEILGGPGVTDGASSVLATDIDGDGDVDLVSANQGAAGVGNGLTVFFGGR